VQSNPANRSWFCVTYQTGKLEFLRRSAKKSWSSYS